MTTAASSTDRHAPPDGPRRRPDRRRDAQLDSRRGVSGQEIVDLHPFDRFDGLSRDRVAAHLVMGPERLDREPVGEQPTGPHWIQPGGLDHAHSLRGALTEEPFPVLGAGCRPRPDAAPWAVPAGT